MPNPNVTVTNLPDHFGALKSDGADIVGHVPVTVGGTVIALKDEIPELATLDEGNWEALQIQVNGDTVHLQFDGADPVIGESFFLGAGMGIEAYHRRKLIHCKVVSEGASVLAIQKLTSL